MFGLILAMIFNFTLGVYVGISIAILFLEHFIKEDEEPDYVSEFFTKLKYGKDGKVLIFTDLNGRKHQIRQLKDNS